MLVPRPAFTTLPSSLKLGAAIGPQRQRQQMTTVPGGYVVLGFVSRGHLDPDGEIVLSRVL